MVTTVSAPTTARCPSSGFPGGERTGRRLDHDQGAGSGGEIGVGARAQRTVQVPPAVDGDGRSNSRPRIAAVTTVGVPVVRDDDGGVPSVHAVAASSAFPGAALTATGDRRRTGRAPDRCAELLDR